MNAPTKPFPLGLTLLIVLALLLSSALVARPVSAASIVVNSNEDVVGDDGQCTLREAIHNANNATQLHIGDGECASGSAGADTITFANNYIITLNSEDKQLVISSEIIIIGTGSPYTIIQASGCNPVILEPSGCIPATYSVLEVKANGNLTLEEVTVRHGKQYSGGGILNMGTLLVNESIISGNFGEAGGGGIINESDSNVTIFNSSLTGNQGGLGGAIWNNSANFQVFNSAFSNNIALYDGGAIYNLGDMAITNSLFTGNVALNGGGISNDYATMTVATSTFSDNWVFYNGGGIYNTGSLEIVGSKIIRNWANIKGGGVFSNGTLEVDQSTFLANTANLGGGIRNDEGTQSQMTVTDSTFFGNQAAHGGAIDVWGGGPNKISTSSFYGNAATASGGAIRIWSILTMENSTLSGNSTDSVGGGFNVQDSGVLTLQHVTLNENTASSGGGIYVGSNAAMKYINTIIAHSTGGDCVNNGTINLESTHNLVTDGSCGALLDDDPMLSPLANYGGPTLTHALLPGSPAIDAGSMADCVSTDQRGFYRPIDGNGDGVLGCDIGAFEFDPAMDGLMFIYLPLIMK